MNPVRIILMVKSFCAVIVPVLDSGFKFNPSMPSAQRKPPKMSRFELIREMSAIVNW
jgi:hypothetical protein